MSRLRGVKKLRSSGCEFGEDFDYDVDFLDEAEQEELEDIIRAFRKEVRENHKAVVDYHERIRVGAQEKLKKVLTDGREGLSPSEVKALIEISTGLSMEVTDAVNMNDLIGVAVPEGMDPITMGFCHKSLKSDFEDLLEAIDNKLARFLGEDTKE